MSQYTTVDKSATLNPGFTRLDPVRMRPNITAVKEQVRIETVAADLGGEFREISNDRLIGRCLNPDHEDKTPSFSIYTDTQRFKCYGCQESGDVLDLMMLVENCELHDVLVSLSLRYGIELPGRPDSWHAKQKRQQPVRDQIDQEKIEHIRFLVWRLVFMPWLERLPGWGQRDAAESAWEETRSIATMLYEERRET